MTAPCDEDGDIWSRPLGVKPHFKKFSPVVSLSKRNPPAVNLNQVSEWAGWTCTSEMDGQPDLYGLVLAETG